MDEVKIAEISISNLGFVILLQSIKDKRTLPIFVGIPEAQSILIIYEKIKTPRPLTLDLLKNLFNTLDSRIDKVIIDDYVNHSYNAKVYFENSDSKYQVEARPSDAIAIALKFNVKIFVDSNIMDTYSINLKYEKDEDKLKDKEYPNKLSEKNIETFDVEKMKIQKKEVIDLTQKEYLEKQLKNAIEEERYEDAAFIRDQLKKL